MPLSVFAEAVVLKEVNGCNIYWRPRRKRSTDYLISRASSDVSTSFILSLSSDYPMVNRRDIEPAALENH